MDPFDPTLHVEGSELLVESYGEWPSFHDAEVHQLNLWRGDMRPDDDVWIGATIEATFELTALIEPFIVIMRFHDCDAIEMADFNHCNMIYDLFFEFEHRGFYADNVTPLSPYIRVNFQPSFGASLQFKCMRVEVIERREIDRSNA